MHTLKFLLHEIDAEDCSSCLARIICIVRPLRGCYPCARRPCLAAALDRPISSVNFCQTKPQALCLILNVFDNWRKQELVA